jgi:hypothetical protein
MALFIFACVFVALARGCYAWGAEGHRIIAFDQGHQRVRSHGLFGAFVWDHSAGTLVRRLMPVDAAVPWKDTQLTSAVLLLRGSSLRQSQ